jgi:predicted ATPase
VLRGDAPRSRRLAGNLDVPLTSFVGRDDDVRDVVGLLDRARLVTLAGPGGAGKTRLANTIGRRLTPAGGVWFVPLAPVDADAVPGAVRDVLRARRPRGRSPRTRSWTVSSRRSRTTIRCWCWTTAST